MQYLCDRGSRTAVKYYTICVPLCLFYFIMGQFLVNVTLFYFIMGQFLVNVTADTLGVRWIR